MSTEILIFDITGTGLMMDMAGGLAFHRFSVVVWLVWLVPCFTGFSRSMVLTAP